MNYRFGVYELDTFSAPELRLKGRRVPLQEQPLQVLQALLERPGEVVSREDLRQRLWPEDVFVDFDFDNGINAAVGRLREALDDAASNPRFVATVPRRGYRFIAPLESLPKPDEFVASTTLLGWWQLAGMGTAKLMVIVGAAILVGALGGALLKCRSDTPAPSPSPGLDRPHVGPSSAP
jgi:DNA-binding winged helix-turn-helix (wHTH) protein